jgi:pteridine reductase
MPPPRPVALVTGAGVRVGNAIARHLAKHGYLVVGHYRSHKPRGFAEAFQADLALPDGPATLAAAFRRRFGRLDLLVNSAAGFEERPIEEIDAASFDEQMQLNARAPLLLTRALLQPLRKAGGSVVNVIDVGGGLVPWRRYAAYAASKAALARITECLALELAPKVRVNGVLPGAALFPKDWPAAKIRDHVRKIPLLRAGTPEDVAAAVRFLAEAPYITGALLPVDGGRHLAGRQ